MIIRHAINKILRNKINKLKQYLSSKILMFVKNPGDYLNP